MVQGVRNIIFQRKFNAKTSSNGGLRLESLVVDLGINMLWPQAGRDCRPYSCRKTVTMCAARAKCGSNVAQKMARWALVKAWIAPKMGCNVLKYLKWPKHQYTGAFKPLPLSAQTSKILQDSHIFCANPSEMSVEYTHRTPVGPASPRLLDAVSGSKSVGRAM